MIMKQNRDGPPARQQARRQNLMRCLRQLLERGYDPRWDVHELGRKEITRLVHDWRSSGLSHRTIANRLVDLRWLAGKVGRLDRIPSNKALGIPSQGNVLKRDEDRARELDYAVLRKLEVHAQLVTELRREFGLRCAEAAKFQHGYATRESREPDRIRLAASWCKGGKPREIFITTDRQRDLLNRVCRHQNARPGGPAGPRSMIPVHMTFRDYLSEYNRACYAVGVPGDELRHAWAQERFETITGFPPPLAGGPDYGHLPETGRSRWDEAEKILRLELGIAAERKDSIGRYIGRKSQV